MPYTDDPVNLPEDELRFLVGDVDAAKPEFTDEQIAYLLAAEGDNVKRAAARAAETLAARYSRIAVEKKVGPLSISYSKKAEGYTKLAKDLWARAASGMALPFAGGISHMDKVARASDTDRVRPAFGRRMMEYPNGAPVSSEDERLSPS